MGMKKIEGILDARPVQQEKLSAKKYLSLSKAERSSIAETRIQAPKFGSGNFGGLIVKYKSPIYKVG